MRSPSRRLIAAAGFGLALLVLLLGLRALAASITAGHLLHASERTLASVQAGQPLWQWQPRKPDDLVAGRAFGAARLEADRHGLRIRSVDGSPFELGLPLTQPIDLAHWPLLELRGSAAAGGRLGLLIRPHETAPACMALQATTLPVGTFAINIDLRRLAWQSAAGGACAPPGVVQMLRLRPQLGADGVLTLQRVALLPAGAPLADATQTGFRLIDESRLGDLLADTRTAPLATPLFRLPAEASAETLLRLRDALQWRWPAALLVVGNQSLVPGGADGAADLAWFAGAGYLLGLIGLVAWPPRRRTGRWLEWFALVLGPLWLVAGLQWGPHTSVPAAAACVAALIYALHKQWRQPRGWHWWNGWRQAWPALLPIPVSLVAVLVFGTTFHPFGLRALAVYLLWAILQQWLLLGVVLPRLETLLPRGAVLLLVALVFALLHTPNGNLMQLCLLAECWWAWCFTRQRALLPVAVAHASCALLVQAGLVGSALRSLEVSARFFL